MKLMDGKKGIIFGVSNKFGIATAIAQELHNAGAEIAFTYANEAMEGRVRPIAEEMGAKFIEECDVTKEEDLKRVFDKYEQMYGKLDFVVHAVAFAQKEDLMGRFIDTSKAGWDIAMGVIDLFRFRKSCCKLQCNGRCKSSIRSFYALFSD